jgi:AraC family transcriptional regulator, regulatory protein of adaptative response / DNA-3-methyladenine glycosylase II
LVLDLPFTPPLDWPALLTFLRARAIPGVEEVDHREYCRQHVRITQSASGAALQMEVSPDFEASAIPRARHLFDLDADPQAIHDHLSRDPVLHARPGLRVPGCWDPFELAVRAILGQQITVKAASTMAGRLAANFGLSPEALASADLTSIGLIRSRAACIQALARAILDGTITWNAEDFESRLTRIPGIGPWTAHYIAMRALTQADAFPAEDLILRRAASSNGTPLTPKQLLARAEAWRPYRAYAVIALWRKYSEQHA